MAYRQDPNKARGESLPVSVGLQFFGLVDIDRGSEEMRVSLRGVADEELYTVTLTPERGAQGAQALSYRMNLRWAVFGPPIINSEFSEAAIRLSRRRSR